ncbi:hypothetical protein GCAAIG_06895 [Candidatus Electronema halotolerans]
MDIETEILKLLRERNHVSFAELNRIPGFDGEGSISHPRYNNILIWHRVSEEGYHAINNLMGNYGVAITPCEQLVYIIDGLVPNIPIAKSARSYAKPRWLPCVLVLPEAK